MKQSTRNKPKIVPRRNVSKFKKCNVCNGKRKYLNEFNECNSCEKCKEVITKEEIIQMTYRFAVHVTIK